MKDVEKVNIGDNKMKLNENILAKPILEEMSRENLPEGVLCRVSYPICDNGKKNANGRVYEDAVFDRVLKEKDLKEKLENRALFGHAEHPEQTQSNLEKTSHVIFEMWKDNGQVWQKFDVLDTPTGRIVDCLLRANCQVGCSTRAEGDLEEAEDDEGNAYQRVIPESYNYVTTDFTADPSTFGAIPHDIKRNVVSEVEKELKDEKLNGTERQFAQLILESMKCQDSKCVVDGAKKMAEKVKQEKKTVKEKKYIVEGTWSYPHTEEKANKVADLMKESLAPKEADEKLYDLLGNDTLFDAINKAEDNKATDVRSEVKSYIKQMLEMFHKDPGGFKYGFESRALEILHSIVDTETVETVENLIKEDTIKVDAKVKYGDKDAKVEKVEETAVSLLVGTENPTAVNVDGDAAISISPEGLITILPTEALSELGQKELKEPEEVVEPVSEEPPFVEPGTADAVIIGDEDLEGKGQRDGTGPPDGGIGIRKMRGEECPFETEEIPETKKQPDKESIEVGATVKFTKEALETLHQTGKGRLDGLVSSIKFDESNIVEGKVTKIEETGITIALDDGTTVNIEDPTAVNITVTAPAPAEEIEPIGPPEEEIEDMEVAGPLPIEKDIPESKVDEDRDIERVCYGCGKELSATAAFAGQKEMDKANEKSDGQFEGWVHCKGPDEKFVQADDEELKKLWPDFHPGAIHVCSDCVKKEFEGEKESGAFESKKTTEAKLSTEGGVSEEVAAGNLLQDKEGKDWGVKEATDAGLTVTQPGEPGTEKFIAWNDVGSYGFTKVSETKVEEATVVPKDGEWFVESPTGAILGGPYKSKVEADKRKKDVEFYAASKESKVDESKIDEDEWKDLDSSKLSEVSLNEPAGFDSCVDGGGRVRTVSGEAEHGLEPGEYVKYCFTNGKSYRGEVHKKESESKVDEDVKRKLRCSQCGRTAEAVGDIAGKKETIQYCPDCKEQTTHKIIGESISTTAKEIKDLRVEEASTRAERDKAVELLEEITDENTQLEEKTRKEKAFEIKILVNKIEKTLEAKEQEVDALRTKLEEKAKFAADMNKQFEEQKNLVVKAQEQWEDVVVAATNRVNSMEESILDTKGKHQKNLLEVKDGYQKKLNSITKANETKIEKAEEETEKRVKEEVTKEFVKCFIEFKLSETALKVDDNSQALLENCKSLEEVEELLDEIIDAGRRSALHSESITSIQVTEHKVTDPEQEEAERRVGNAYRGMNS